MKNSLKRRIIVVLAATGMIAGLVPGLDQAVSAEGGPGDAGFTTPGQVDVPGRDTRVPNDRGRPLSSSDGSGIEVTVEDRRTVRSDIVPDPSLVDSAEPRAESFDGTTSFERPKSYEGPAGFVEGESVWIEEASTEYVQLFANPDGTVTAIHTVDPSSVADDGYTVEYADVKELQASVGGGFERSGPLGDVRVPEESRADEVLAAVDTPGGTIGLRPGRRELKPESPDEVDEKGEQDASRPGAEAAPGSEASQSDLSRGESVDGLPGVVLFEDLVDDVDVEVSANGAGVKFDYVLETAEQAEGLVETIDFPEGWSVNQLDGFLEILDGKGERVGFWTGGPAEDSSPLEGDVPAAMVRLELIESDATSATARLVVDQGWLESEKTVFPVRLDPEVTIGSAVVQDTWIGEEVPGLPTDDYLRLGSEGGNDRYSLIEFGLLFDDGWSEGPDVVSADLYLTTNSTVACGTRWLYVRRIGNEWDEATVNWATQPGSAYDNEGNVQFNNCSPNTFSLPVENMVQHWMANPGSNHGFLM